MEVSVIGGTAHEVLVLSAREYSYDLGAWSIGICCIPNRALNYFTKHGGVWYTRLVETRCFLGAAQRNTTATHDMARIIAQKAAKLHNKLDFLGGSCAKPPLAPGLLESSS